jgi:hypothetical protein
MTQPRTTCPDCKEMVPCNEWAAYGRHEDCAMNPSREGVALYQRRPSIAEQVAGYVPMGTLAYPVQFGNGRPARTVRRKAVPE